MRKERQKEKQGGQRSTTGRILHMAAKKSAAKKKSSAKKSSGRKARAGRKNAPEMKGNYRAAASALAGVFTERVLDADDLGVVAVTTKEITGKFSGLLTTAKLDDGGKIALSIKRTGPKA